MHNQPNIEMLSRNLRYIIFSAISLMFCYTSLIKAQPICTTRTFSVKDGLTANLIADVHQTPDGMIWMGSWNGLYCYDGYNFSNFNGDRNHQKVLSTRSLSAIKVNKYGDLWCRTYNNRIYLFDYEKCVFIDISKLIKKKLNTDVSISNFYPISNGHTWMTTKEGYCLRVDEQKIKDNEDGIEIFGSKRRVAKKIVEDNSGREWVFTEQGLVLYGSGQVSNKCLDLLCQEGKYVFIASPNGDFGYYLPGMKKLKMMALPKTINMITSVTALGNMHIAIGTNCGVLIYDFAHNKLKTISIQNPSQPSPVVDKIFIDSNHRIWAFAKDGDGVTIIHPKDGRTRWLQAKPNDTKFATTSKQPFIHEDRYNKIWVVPNGGTFSFFNEKTQSLEPYRLEKNSGDNRPLPYFSKYFIDSKKDVWVTGLHNITLLSFRRQNFRYCDLNDDDTRALLWDEKGNLLIGTYSGNLIVVDKTGKKIAEKKIAKFGIYTIYIDRRHRIWLGTKGDGLFMASGDYNNLNIKRFAHSDKDKWSLANDNIYDVAEDTRGRILVATYGRGLNIIDESEGNNFKFIGKDNFLKSFKEDCFDVRRISVTAKGVVILSTNGGIVTYSDSYVNPSKIRFYYSQHVQDDEASLLSSEVMQTYISRSGKIFVSTRGGGVQTIKSGNLLQDNLTFEKTHGAESDEGTIQSFVDDGKGHIWFIRESTINKYDIRNNNLEIFGYNNLPENITFTEAKAAFNEKTLCLAVGVNGGFIIFYPDDIKKSNYCPKIVFCSVQYQGETETEPIMGIKLLEIPANKRNLTVYFSALDFSNDNNIRYAYRIEGIDKEWNYTGKAHSASLGHLRAGHYTLVVKSTNADDVWMKNETRLNFYVHPHVWETIWAKIAYLILIIAAVYYSLKIYRRRSQEVMDKKMNEQRLNFYTDISHQLRTPLTLILGPVKEVLDNEPLTDTSRKYLTFVSDNSKRMLKLLNQTLDLKKMQTDNGHVDLNTVEDIDDKTSMPGNIKSLDTEDLLRSEKKVRLLIVEDNDELRYYLFNALSRDYEVTEARNGKEGLELAESRQPEFIITDLMMPEMDGITMIRKIKSSPDVRHIPIIVLSAKTAITYKIEGMKEGIDDYITKPFSVEYLKTRMRNIIEKRRELQQAYVDKLSSPTGDAYKLDVPEVDNADDILIKNVMAYLNTNASNSDLRIVDIAKSVGLSQTVFYGKMKSIVGMSPGDFLRHVRMEKAKEMIAHSDLTFSEIAYAVGFSDPKYFSRCFKTDVGMTAKDYRIKFKK